MSDSCHILGLDLGANSIGWALLEANGSGLTKIVQSGVRIFPSGVKEGLEKGTEESRAVARRNARLARRQTDRRRRKRTKIARVLQQAGLLPDGDLAQPNARHTVLRTLDVSLMQEFTAQGLLPSGGNGAFAHTFPYWLRAHTLARPLSAHAVGRALYHLGQRRGFLSDRRVPSKKDKESIVRNGILELDAAIRNAGARTLGEYFAGLDPTDIDEQRIRNRWTSRQMYIDEFNAIWSAQAKWNPRLFTDALRNCLFKAIFRQRSLRSARGLVGSCDLDGKRRRAPMAILPAQRFRYFQKLNDLRVILSETEERQLTSEERAAAIEMLETQQELKFTALRKRLKLTGTTFNLEEGGETRLIGNRTGARLRQVFGERWDTFTGEERDRIVEDVLSIEKAETLKARGMRAYGLDEEAAQALSELPPESGYCALSRQALEKLLPLMEEGTPYATARKEVYGDTNHRFLTDFLPSVDEAPFTLRNPVVHRSLTELRKVVNAVVAQYGKPAVIRIELARDMKRTRKEREQAWKKNRQNEKARIDAKKRILTETGIPSPSRGDVEKVLLAEECNWECPYTGRRIRMADLIGDAPQFDVEHIIPYSRCFDNSFLNKTLCYHEENRSRKGGRTPFETYGSNAEAWEDILNRVRRFSGEGRNAKLRRFQLEDLEDFEDFTSRQLNDTRYASRLAADYLGLLYGGRYDADGVLRVQAGRGQVTAEIRKAFNLNRILGDGPGKDRSDHRHHAVDAIAIALTDPKAVKALSTAAARNEKNGLHGWRKNVTPPWASFLEDATQAIEAIVVSQRVSRKVNGPLHEETHYSPPKADEEGRECVHVRRKLEAISDKEVEAIADAAVRDLVKAALKRAGTTMPKQAFANAQNLPRFTTPDGRVIPIKKVRVRRYSKTFTVGNGARQRHVVTASNHHMEIVESTNSKGKTKWEGIIVDQFTAMRRHSARQPLVQRDHGPGKRLVFSLAPGDTFRYELEPGKPELFVVRCVTQGIVEFVRLNDARLKKDIKATGQWFKRSPNVLQNGGCQRVAIAPLGEVRTCNE